MQKHKKSKKITFICSNRSDYGLIRPILLEIVENLHLLEGIRFELVLISSAVTDCIDTVNFDFPRSDIDICLLHETVPENGEQISNHFPRIFPCIYGISTDLLCVAGDRYEIFAICSFFFYKRTPIAHLYGGDISKGGHFDDNVRHAISMLASLHFPVNVEAEKNLKSLFQCESRIFMCGSPVVDDVSALSPNKRFDHDILVSFNPMTTDFQDSTASLVSLTMEAVTRILDEENLTCLVTYPNHEDGSESIIDVYKKHFKNDKITFHKSLGTPDFLYAMRDAELVIGNSSSQLLEAPIIGVKSLVIGKRQLGRYMPLGVSSLLEPKAASVIQEKIKELIFSPSVEPTSDYGVAPVSQRIVGILRHMVSLPPELLISKDFELEFRNK